MNKHSLTLATLSLCFIFGAILPVSARTWSDPTGRHTVDAELVGYSDESVILLRADHHLAAVEIKQLSDEDQTFLKSEKAKAATMAVANRQQTWTTRGGVSIIGNVVDYTSKEVTVQRRRGKVYVNDRVIDNMPKVYQIIVPKVVAHFEGNAIKDKKSLESWLTHKKGASFSYQCDGVIIALENGDEYAIPFFLMCQDDLDLMKPGWDDWSQANDNSESRQRAASQLQSLAAAKQQDAKITRRIGRMQLGLQAVEAGVTSLWEVTLYPARGVAGPPQWVVVPGRDSRAATSVALGNNPGYSAGPVRKVSR